MGQVECGPEGTREHPSHMLYREECSWFYKFIVRESVNVARPTYIGILGRVEDK